MVQTVRLTIDIAQLLYTVIDVPIVQVVQVPLFLTVSYMVWCSPAEYEKLGFSWDASGNFSVFRTLWFDSGYIFGVTL